MTLTGQIPSFPEVSLILSPHWTDYELLDSGDGQKLERFGAYRFVRPEAQAFWHKTLPAEAWQAAHAVFCPTREESGGYWKFQRKIPDKWEMGYELASLRSPISGRRNGTGALRFWVQTTPGRHLGIFPEGAAHWDWIVEILKTRRDSPNILNLFGYTGLATLAAAAAGAQVTHVDASKKAVSWARQNQELSGLVEARVRWIVDDVRKFVQREARRGVKYDGIMLDPPKFGRGPKGEVWEVYQSLPGLLQACQQVLSEKPLFIILTVYAVKVSSLHIFQALKEMMKPYAGVIECGELVSQEKSAGRLLSSAVFARWRAG